MMFIWDTEEVKPDPVDDAIYLINRATKRALPWLLGILVGVVLGYAWRMAQTGGF